MLSLYFGLEVFCQVVARIEEFETVFHLHSCPSISGLEVAEPIRKILATNRRTKHVQNTMTTPLCWSGNISSLGLEKWLEMSDICVCPSRKKRSSSCSSFKRRDYCCATMCVKKELLILQVKNKPHKDCKCLCIFQQRDMNSYMSNLQNIISLKRQSMATQRILIK
jgi:hypothetical protein